MLSRSSKLRPAPPSLSSPQHKDLRELMVAAPVLKGRLGRPGLPGLPERLDRPDLPERLALPALKVTSGSPVQLGLPVPPGLRAQQGLPVSLDLLGRKETRA